MCQTLCQGHGQEPEIPQQSDHPQPGDKHRALCRVVTEGLPRCPSCCCLPVVGVGGPSLTHGAGLAQLWDLFRTATGSLPRNFPETSVPVKGTGLQEKGRQEQDASSRSWCRLCKREARWRSATSRRRWEPALGERGLQGFMAANRTPGGPGQHAAHACVFGVCHAFQREAPYDANASSVGGFRGNC